MKVKAIGTGVYNGGIKERGEVFEIPDELFHASWMEKIEEPIVPEPTIEPIQNIEPSDTVEHKEITHEG